MIFLLHSNFSESSALGFCDRKSSSKSFNILSIIHKPPKGCVSLNSYVILSQVIFASSLKVCYNKDDITKGDWIDEQG